MLKIANTITNLNIMGSDSVKRNPYCCIKNKFIRNKYVSSQHETLRRSLKTHSRYFPNRVGNEINYL